MGRESTGHTYPEIGVPEAHHPTSHHAMRPELLEKLAKINAYHVKMFAYFLERLRSTPDGDGNLLDHSMLIYGAGFSNSDQHLHHNLPVLLAGGGAGQLKGGRHIRYADETPIANLHASVLDLMGVPVTNFGDATGRLEGLTRPEVRTDCSERRSPNRRPTAPAVGRSSSSERRSHRKLPPDIFARGAAKALTPLLPSRDGQRFPPAAHRTFVPDS